MGASRLRVKHCADHWPAGGVFLGKLTVAQLVHKFHALYETHSFVTVSATAATCRCTQADSPFKVEAQTALFKDPVRTAL